MLRKITYIGFVASALLLTAGVVQSFSDDRVTISYNKPVTRSEPPRFNEIDDASVKKEAFFDYLLPIAQQELDKIIGQRSWLLDQQLRLKQNQPLTRKAKVQIDQLLLRYDLEKMPDYASLIKQLLRRVDVVPISMLLAQAALESGWGTSRFARKGNNYFGQWCYSTGCGIVPANRSTGSNHEVKRFKSPSASVRQYILNINRHHAYEAFRATRAELRARKAPVTGMKLAKNLVAYSQEREAYVDKVRRLIKSNNLDRYDL